VQELARQKSPEAINTLSSIMNDEKAPPAGRVAAANALLDRGYGKPTQPITQTLAKIDPGSISDEELAAIAINAASVPGPRTYVSVLLPSWYLAANPTHSFWQPRRLRCGRRHRAGSPCCFLVQGP
jgi:hypothetical protein